MFFPPDDSARWSSRVRKRHVNRGNQQRGASQFHDDGMHVGRGRDAARHDTAVLQRCRLADHQEHRIRTVVELDDLGLQVGQDYDLHVFAADRNASPPEIWLELPACGD